MTPTTVTVGGLPGTGTSTLCKLLEAQLRLPYTYAGAIFREEAKRRGMTLSEFGALCQRDPTIDEALDDRQIGILRRGNVILEGRLSGWLAARHRIPAFKIWVTCDPKERIRRIVQRDGGDAGTQQRLTEEREASEQDRYLRYYGADLNDLSRYDLVLDSTRMAPEELAAKAVAAIARVA